MVNQGRSRRICTVLTVLVCVVGVAEEGVAGGEPGEKQEDLGLGIVASYAQRLQTPNHLFNECGTLHAYMHIDYTHTHTCT